MRLPPLNALRIFEVAARHENFSKAAEELHISQPAVSKQVALLEDHLNCLLFERQNRSLTLTRKGRECSRFASQCFNTLSHNISTLNDAAPQRLSILSYSDFAMLWLFPRMQSFEAQFPNITVSVDTRIETLPPLTEEIFDIAVLWGKESWKQYVFEPLFRSEIFPVCSPDFFASHMSDGFNLTGSDLIIERTPSWWRAFLPLLGVEDINIEEGKTYRQAPLCFEAAARGNGIALGDDISVRQYLEDGRLIAPFSVKFQSPEFYYILTLRSEHSKQETVQLYRDWLIKEAAQHKLWFADYWAKRKETNVGHFR